MAAKFTNNLNLGINLDLDNLRLPPNSAVFIKNITNNVNLNAGAPAGGGNNQFVYTPLEGNVALSLSGMPSGTNYCIGFYSSEQTNEGYFAVFNSAGNHTIWVINGDDGSVTLVHQNTLLPFVLDPQYFLSEGRMTLELRSVIDPATSQETNFKFLIFTNNNKYQCLIDVAASIATNSYTTSYFTTTAAYYNPLELIHLGVTLPIKCMGLNSPNPYMPMNSSGVIDATSIDNPGHGYSDGSGLISASIFSISGGSGGQGKVTSVGSSGEVLGFILINGGTGYSIATNSATATLPGSIGTALTVNILSLVIPDTSKQNLIINEGWQFRVRTWDVWGRPSDWGIVSSVFTVLTGGGCFSTSNSLARCVNLCFDAGNPLVKFITIAYRKSVGNDPNGAIETGWLEHETIRVYNDSGGMEWYNRLYNPAFTTANSGMTFNVGTNTITYTFCADKGSNPVDPTQAALTQPGLPISSSSVFPVSKALGLANNVYDFDPISQTIIDNIQFSVTNPPDQAPCPPAILRTIIVYAAVWQGANGVVGHCRFSNGLFVWGEKDGKCGEDTNRDNSIEVDQVFGDQINPGFIAYLAGTPFSCVGVQGTLDVTTGTFSSFNAPNGFNFTDSSIKPIIQFVFTDIPAANYVVRIASHKASAPDGNLQRTSTYVGGLAEINDWTNSGSGSFGLNNYSFDPLKEILADCTFSNVELSSTFSPMFVILDLSGTPAIDGYLYEQNGEQVPVEMTPVWALNSADDTFSSFFTDHNGFYFANGGTAGKTASIIIFSSFCGTDCVLDPTQCTYWRTLYGPNNAAHAPSAGGTIGLTCTRGILHGDGSGPANTCGNVKGNWQNAMYLLPTFGNGTYNKYPAAARRTTIQNIYVCGTTAQGLPGVPVVWTNGPFGQTDSNGNLILIAHNLYNYLTSLLGVPGGVTLRAPFLSSNVPDFTVSPNDQEQLIFSQKGSGCQWNVCGSCDTGGVPATVVNYLACSAPYSGCSTPMPDRTLCLPTLHLRPNGIGISGIQTGGKYPVAFWLHDVIRRHTSPLIRQGDNGYVFVPNLTDYQAMALPSLKVSIPGGLVVDSRFTHITFLVASNVNFDDYFSWAADWVQYINNAGIPDDVNPTAIRIYFNSLNEYNKLYNFKTNVAWDFLTTSQVAGTPADVCQFIINGDGSWLPPQKGFPISYNQYGSFFTIPFAPELSGLQNGCLFRIIRPKQNTTSVDLPYYEQCLTLSITNGLLPTGSYILPYKDSYLLARSIPVPLFKGISNPISPGANPPSQFQLTSTNQNASIDTGGYSQNNANNANNVIIVQAIDYPTGFPFFFESPSPSDLWGSHLATLGRIGIPNPYEVRFRNGTEIALSNNVSNIGFENGMSTFLDVNKYSFDKNTWGNITVVLVETSVCLVICDRDHFVIRYNATNLIVTPQGVIGQNQQGPFTTPERKAGTNYGCAMTDINTIRRYAGIVRWLDSSGYIVLHNFSVANSMTDQDGYKGYLLNKIGVVNNNNKNGSTLGSTYWVGGIDPKNMEYVLTTFYLPTLAHPFPPKSYINTQSAPNLSVNETLIFDLYATVLKSFASFTPEMYGIIPGYFSQRQFLSFKGGIPYIHHNNLNVATPPPYLKFYDVQTADARITQIVNGVDGKLLPDKVKRFFYVEVYCKQWIPGATGTFPTPMFYSDVVTTESIQTSRLLIGQWVYKNGFWCAYFLNDINTPTDPNQPAGIVPIIDGNPLIGCWAQLNLVLSPLYTGQYFEISETAVGINGVEPSG